TDASMNGRELSLDGDLDPPSASRFDKLFVVLFGLFCIAHRKFGDRIVQCVAFAAVARNRCWITRLRMGQCERPATETTVVVKGLEIVERGIPLQFCKLTNIKLFFVNLRPPQKDIGRSLRQALPEYDPAALMVERQFEVGIRFKDRG